MREIKTKIINYTEAASKALAGEEVILIESPGDGKKIEIISIETTEAPGFKRNLKISYKIIDNETNT